MRKLRKHTNFTTKAAMRYRNRRRVAFILEKLPCFEHAANGNMHTAGFVNCLVHTVFGNVVGIG